MFQVSTAAALRVASRFRVSPTISSNGFRFFNQSVATLSTQTASFSTIDSDNPDDRSIWDKADLHRIFDNNLAWREKMLKDDPEFFNKLAAGQSPDYLLIGCSDSRVGAQEIMGLHQGELFVHRNIANQVVPTDLNLLSVIFYSVNVLKVKDIIVLGHYGCGGVAAASQNKDLGTIEHWLHNIRDVQRLHKEELKDIDDSEKKFRRLVELNVQEQCFNLFTNSIIQQMQAKTGRPRIHGMVYDIADGYLKYLDIDWKAQVRQFRSIYSVADFRRHEPIDIKKVGGETKKAILKVTPDPSMTIDSKTLAQHLFDAIDTERTGKISKDAFLNLFEVDNEDLTEEELEQAIKPLLAMDRDSFDLKSFERILKLVHLHHEEEHETDRLVVIRPLDGRDPPQPLRCHANTTVLELKQAISEMVGTPIEQQTLFFAGSQLKDEVAHLSEIGIHEIAEVEFREDIVPVGFKKPST